LRALPERVLRAVEILLGALEERGVRVEEAYLFGSYARGDWIESSDVDLVIVSSSFQGSRFIDRLELIYRVEWELGVKPWIEVIPLTPSEFQERLATSVVLRDASKYWVKVK